MVHRDIKPDNFLIFDGTIKICDFGISREIFTQKSVFDTKNLQGTAIYIAPELIEIENFKKGNTPAIDMWSLGITFYYMITFRYPWDFPDHFFSLDFEQKNNFMLKLLQQPVTSIEGISPVINFMIQQCLKVNPRERITSNTMLEMLVSLMKDMKLPNTQNITFENFSNYKNFDQSSSCKTASVQRAPSPSPDRTSNIFVD